MSHNVISMTDSNYFFNGIFLMETRKKVNAHFIVYGPDLSKDEIAKLTKHNMEYRKVDQNTFNTKMQSLKFKYLLDSESIYTTYLDWDTFIVKDWTYDVFECKKFNLGVTVRNKMIQEGCLRAFTNGGVIFTQNHSYQRENTLTILEMILNIIGKGECKLLPEYDEIWKTLEIGRRPEKTHFRTDYRWWCDQVILSSLVLYYIRKYKKNSIPDYLEYEFNKTIIGMFNCDKYNCISAHPSYNDNNYYIGHLKKAGRVKTFGKDVTKEKL